MKHPCSKCSKPIPNYLLLCDECIDNITKEEIRMEEEVNNCEQKKEASK